MAVSFMLAAIFCLSFRSRVRRREQAHPPERLFAPWMREGTNRVDRGRMTRPPFGGQIDAVHGVYHILCQKEPAVQGFGLADCPPRHPGGPCSGREDKRAKRPTHIMALRKFGERAPTLQRLKRHFRLETRCVVPATSIAHLSLLFLGEYPHQPAIPLFRLFRFPKPPPWEMRTREKYARAFKQDAVRHPPCCTSCTPPRAAERLSTYHSEIRSSYPPYTERL